MRIDVIDNIEDFKRLKANWDAVYESDPESQFYLSWTWMEQWLPSLTSPWFILAVKKSPEDSEYVGFLPLRVRIRMRKGIGFYNEINPAGNYSSDYTGIICSPQVQNQVIPAFARYLKTLNWMRINFEYWSMSEERLRQLMAHFPQSAFRVVPQERTNQPDNINNLICPRISLPDTWDGYLSTLSANTRQKIRRFLRAYEGDSRFRVTFADAGTLERDLTILFDFWKEKWGARKGKRLPGILTSNRAMMVRSFQRGFLYLPILWLEDRPLCALACFIDAQKGAMLFYMGGRDESFNNPPPGTVLHALCIKDAISRGFKTYDFLRGNEEYKYSFGAQEHHLHCFELVTKSGRNLNDKLDPRTVESVLEKTTALHKSGELGDAERGYRQVLDAVPSHTTALYCLGQLMTTKGDHRAATRLYRALLASKPGLVKAWVRLGKSLHTQERFAEAAEAFREAIKRHPESPACYIGLGNALLRQGNLEAAIAEFETAHRLSPKDDKLKNMLESMIGKVGRRIAPVERPEQPTVH